MQFLTSSWLQEHTTLAMKLIPCYHKLRLNKLAHECLAERDEISICQAWNACDIFEEYVLFNRTIASHFAWKCNLFHPLDECFVVFRMWQKMLSDDMALPVFLCEMEDMYACKISEKFFTNMRIPLLTFFQHLSIGGNSITRAT